MRMFYYQLTAFSAIFSQVEDKQSPTCYSMIYCQSLLIAFWPSYIRLTVIIFFVIYYKHESSLERFLMILILMMKSLVAEQQYLSPMRSSSDSINVIWWSEDWYTNEYDFGSYLKAFNANSLRAVYVIDLLQRWVWLLQVSLIIILVILVNFIILNQQPIY